MTPSSQEKEQSPIPGRFNGTFALVMEPHQAPIYDNRLWRLKVVFEGVPFGEDGPNLIWSDLAGLASMWTATEASLDPDSVPPNQILATILGDDRLYDAALPNLGECFDQCGPIRRYRWKDDVIWLYEDSSDADGNDRVRIARVPADGYMDVIQRATDHYLLAQG